MNYRIIITLVFLNLNPLISSFGQTLHKQDSLKTLLETTQGTERYYILKELSWEARNTNPAEAYFYGLQALKAAEKLNLLDEIASINNYLGVYKRNQNNYTKALSHFFVALQLADSSNNKVEIGYAHNNIGDIYRRLENNSLAIVNFSKALEIFTEIKKNRGIAYCYNQLSLLHIDINDFEKALYYNNESIKLRKKLDDWTGIASNYRNSGDIYIKKDDYVMAEAYYKMAMEIDQKFDQKHGLGFTQNHIGRLYNIKGQYKQAIPYLKKGLKIGEELESALIINHSTKQLSFAYEKLGNIEKAYEYYKLYKSSGDSLYNEQNTKSITQLTMQFEFDRQQIQKESEAQQVLKRQRLKLNLVLAGLFFTVITAFLLYRSFSVKKKANELLNEKNAQINEQKEELIQINTQLKQNEQEIRAANDTKDKFFSIIAHDLRSPFNTIFGFTNLLYKDIEDYDDHTTKDFLLKILAVTDNAYKLLQNLLDWSMSQTGSLKYNPIDFDLFSIVESTLELLNSSAVKKEIKIDLQIEKNCIVHGDLNMISTICRNLISNAIKFTPRNGNITISCYKKEKEAIVTFTDTGVGISNVNISRLFKIETKFKTDGTEQEKGTGLGLILCEEFIKRHGGKIWVESIEGEGSKFLISLQNSKH